MWKLVLKRVDGIMMLKLLPTEHMHADRHRTNCLGPLFSMHTTVPPSGCVIIFIFSFGRALSYSCARRCTHHFNGRNVGSVV